MTAASEKELSELHNKVAKTLMEKLNSSDQATYLLSVYGGEELPEEILDYLRKQSDASPALLTVITKFLKDNGITAVVEESKELTDLDKRLKEKRQRRVGNVLQLHEEE